MQSSEACEYPGLALLAQGMAVAVLEEWCMCRPDQAYVAAKRLLTMVGVKIRQHQMAGPVTISQGSFVLEEP